MPVLLHDKLDADQHKSVRVISFSFPSIVGIVIDRILGIHMHPIGKIKYTLYHTFHSALAFAVIVQNVHYKADDDPPCN